tara:strand:- start:279 stop:545 length:267 start_codon:yes stop_codon:yes gene_type:complete
MSDGLSVPVFNCVIYLRRLPEGGVSGRVANLAGLEHTAPNERDLLSHLLRHFKERVTTLISSGEEIPWIEPPPAPETDEETRLVPMHL